MVCGQKPLEFVEKFVARAACQEGALENLRRLLCAVHGGAVHGPAECLLLCATLGGALLDLCGVAALGAGLGAGSLPPALAVGYSVTALAAACFIGLFAASDDPGTNKVAAVGAVLAAAAFGVPLGLGLHEVEGTPFGLAAAVSLLLCALSGAFAMVAASLRTGGLCCLVLWLLLGCAFLYAELSDDGGSASGSS